jgi:mannose-6-phosphate isomerase-like protein (cupin superfamily)
LNIDKVSINEKLSTFNEYWNPHIIGDLNGQYIKVVKFKGEFTWHHHKNEDEMFMVIKGEFEMEMRDKKVKVQEGEFIIIPKGIEHKPFAEKETHVLLFEPVTTLNTGNVKNEFTKENITRI